VVAAVLERWLGPRDRQTVKASAPLDEEVAQTAGGEAD
jgi:hypothetical protein